MARVSRGRGLVLVLVGDQGAFRCRWEDQQPRASQGVRCCRRTLRRERKGGRDEGDWRRRWEMGDGRRSENDVGTRMSLAMARGRGERQRGREEERERVPVPGEDEGRRRARDPVPADKRVKGGGDSDSDR